jgi:hypothetical protein
MATIRQLNANRENAQLSTGPTSEEGKAHSRGNALKHGLAGAGVVLDADDTQAVAQRLDAWRSDFGPLAGQQEWLYERMVVASVRIDRCSREQSKVQSYQAERARTCWNADRQLEADEIAASLSRRPSLVIRRLGRTRQGCEWMIDQWGELGLVHQVNLEWNEAQTSTALDLLGIAPALRDGVGFPPNQPLDQVVSLAITGLQKRIDAGLADLDVREQEYAESGEPITPSRDLIRLRRYEADCMRDYYRSRSELLTSLAKTNTAEPGLSTQVSVPQSEPQPEPVSISALGPDDMRLMGHALTDLAPPAVEPEPEVAPPVVPGPALEAVVGIPGHRLNRRQRRAAEKRARSR